jgi:hypothetical protein
VVDSLGFYVSASELIDWEKGLDIGSIVEARFRGFRVRAKVIKFNVCSVRVELLEQAASGDRDLACKRFLPAGTTVRIPSYTWGCGEFGSQCPVPGWSDNNGIFPIGSSKQE